MPTPSWWTKLQASAQGGSPPDVADVADAVLNMLQPAWVNGPVDFNDFTDPGSNLIAGEFLAEDTGGEYHVPGNTGALFLTVRTVPHYPDTPAPEFGAVVVLQEYVTADGQKRGQRNRWDNSWSDWTTY